MSRGKNPGTAVGLLAEIGCSFSTKYNQKKIEIRHNGVNLNHIS